MPPVAASVALYAVFSVPAGKELVVMLGCDAFTVMLKAFVALCAFKSLTCAVKLLVPAPVGVPEITPLLGARVNPAGKVPETIDHV